MRDHPRRNAKGPGTKPGGVTHLAGRDLRGQKAKEPGTKPGGVTPQAPLMRHPGSLPTHLAVTASPYHDKRHLYTSAGSSLCVEGRCWEETGPMVSPGSGAGRLMRDAAPLPGPTEDGLLSPGPHLRLALSSSELSLVKLSSDSMAPAA